MIMQCTYEGCMVASSCMPMYHEHSRQVISYTHIERKMTFSLGSDGASLVYVSTYEGLTEVK